MILQRSLPLNIFCAVGALIVNLGVTLFVLKHHNDPGAVEIETATVSLNLVQTQIVDAVHEAVKPDALAVSVFAHQKQARREKEQIEKKIAEKQARLLEQKKAEQQRLEYERLKAEKQKQAKIIAAKALALERKRLETEKKRLESVKVVEPTSKPVVGRVKIIQSKKQKKARHIKKKPPRKLTVKSLKQAKASASSSPISASRGQIQNYAMKVRRHLSRHRPKGRGQRGTVIIAFGLSRSGGLRYARIAHSNGHTEIDRLAVNAIRQAAPFPNPPPGMNLSELSYRMSFMFK